MQDLKRSSIPFNKYNELGAYHWIQCNRSSSNYNPPLEARYQIVLRHMKKANKALDIGCGDGYLMSLLKPFVQQIVGIDFESRALSLAKEKLISIKCDQVVQGSCYELPFGNRSFDLVLLSDVIEHLEWPKESLSEIRRVLISSGTLLVTTPRWRKDRRWDECHIREFKPEELRHLLEQFFSEVTLSFFWPLWWSNLYATKYGWHLIRLFSRYLYNPFLKETAQPEKLGQIFAVCKGPR